MVVRRAGLTRLASAVRWTTATAARGSVGLIGTEIEAVILIVLAVHPAQISGLHGHRSVGAAEASIACNGGAE